SAAATLAARDRPEPRGERLTALTAAVLVLRGRSWLRQVLHDPQRLDQGLEHPLRERSVGLALVSAGAVGPQQHQIGPRIDRILFDRSRRVVVDQQLELDPRATTDQALTYTV